MSEVHFTKQLEPLIKKYGINPETNQLFQDVINLFPDTPNYQVWAVKVVFSKAANFETLTCIKNWAVANSLEIKHLTKQNIVAYSNNNAINQLLREMEGLDHIALVKKYINTFNTDQRHMLEDAIPLNLNGLDAITNSTFNSWYKIFAKFDKLSQNRKHKFVSLCSAFRDASAIKDGLSHAVEESYSWNKEDMLAFMHNNAPDCKVIVDHDNIVVLEIPSFEASRKLCGGGRTGWCITRESSYFRQYVTEYTNPKHTQYFFFNFDKPEKDEFAHIGFTVEENRGIVNAHSTTNQNLLGGGINYHGEKVNIYKALSYANVSMGSFFSLKKLHGFEWNLESLLNFAKANESSMSIAYHKDGRIILRALTKDGLSKLIGHTFINTGNFHISLNGNESVYILMDFNHQVNDDKSIIVMQFKKDEYKIDSLNRMMDAYGTLMEKNDYLPKVGICIDDFINREKISPTILLHKLIDEGSEAQAIKLIADQGDDFDVNYEFNGRIPVFSAINKKFFNLFRVIINHKGFDTKKTDGYGETLLSSLLYAYGTDGIQKSSDDDRNLKLMITSILESPAFDFNEQDINYQTPINIATDTSKTNWVVKALAENPTVDINIIDDFNRTPFTNALAKGNIDAAKLIGKRPDLQVRNEDKKIAKRKGINLDDIVKPDTTFKVSVANVNNNDDPERKEIREMFAEIFNDADQ